MDRLRHRYLSYFAAAFDHRSIGAAAQAMHVSQPAMAKAIARLEEQLGVQLFERESSGLRPTKFANELRRQALAGLGARLAVIPHAAPVEEYEKR